LQFVKHTGECLKCDNWFVQWPVI